MGVSVRLLGMALILISGEGSVAEMRVDGEQWHVLQGLAMLLIGGMLMRRWLVMIVEGCRSDDASKRCC